MGNNIYRSFNFIYNYVLWKCEVLGAVYKLSPSYLPRGDSQVCLPTISTLLPCHKNILWRPLAPSYPLVPCWGASSRRKSGASIRLLTMFRQIWWRCSYQTCRDTHRAMSTGTDTVIWLETKWKYILNFYAGKLLNCTTRRTTVWRPQNNIKQ